jgi:hypothetical protein
MIVPFFLYAKSSHSLSLSLVRRVKKSKWKTSIEFLRNVMIEIMDIDERREHNEAKSICVCLQIHFLPPPSRDEVHLLLSFVKLLSILRKGKFRKIEIAEREKSFLTRCLHAPHELIIANESFEMFALPSWRTFNGRIIQLARALALN